MSNTSTLISFLIVLLCLSATINARNCPRFYKDVNHQGRSFQLCSGGNVAAAWNDKVSSFYVPKGYLVTLYEDYNHGGRKLGPYRTGWYNVPGDFNDKLSSVDIRKGL